jgi:hypothetical protein
VTALEGAKLLRSAPTTVTTTTTGDVTGVGACNGITL